MLDVYTFAERQKIGKGIMGHWRALVRGPSGYNSDLGIWGSGDLGIWGSGDLGIWGSGQGGNRRSLPHKRQECAKGGNKR
jgi:hypothetical protein